MAILAVLDSALQAATDLLEAMTPLPRPPPGVQLEAGPVPHASPRLRWAAAVILRADALQHAIRAYRLAVTDDCFGDPDDPLDPFPPPN